MKQRKGLGKGLGQGYKNLAIFDSHIHSLSAKGVKTITVDFASRKSTKNAGTQRMKLYNQGFKETMTEKVGEDKFRMTFKKIDDTKVTSVPKKKMMVGHELDGDVYATEDGKVYKYKGTKKSHFSNPKHWESLNAKKKLNIWQKIGIQEKPHRGRPPAEHEVRILTTIPTGLTPRMVREAKKKAKLQTLTKREKKLAMYNLVGAGLGYSIGGLVGGLGGMVIGVPIGTMTAFAIGEYKLGKPKGRAPKYTKSKSQIWQDFWITREEELEYRKEMVAKEKKGELSK